MSVETIAPASGPNTQFMGRIIGILNDGMLALMISVGHRTKLFDVMAASPAATSAEIAMRAGLKERYVREWLGAMTTGKIVDYDPKGRTYALPADRAAFITRAAGIDNLATFSQFVALLGTVEGQIVRSFREGGGVPIRSSRNSNTSWQRTARRHSMLGCSRPRCRSSPDLSSD